jgi:hypothetical protein
VTILDSSGADNWTLGLHSLAPAFRSGQSRSADVYGTRSVADRSRGLTQSGYVTLVMSCGIGRIDPSSHGHALVRDERWGVEENANPPMIGSRRPT